MNKQNLIIYKFTSLFQILEELALDLNFIITSANNDKSLNDKMKSFNNYLVLSDKKYTDIGNQFVLNNIPINIFELVEKINIEFLKIQFSSQSEVKINNYTIDLNSREMMIVNTKLKLTEKEININFDKCRRINLLEKENRSVCSPMQCSRRVCLHG